jgi:hypothetical protein
VIAAVSRIFPVKDCGSQATCGLLTNVFPVQIWRGSVVSATSAVGAPFCRVHQRLARHYASPYDGLPSPSPLRTTDFPVRRSFVRRTSQSVAPSYDGLPSPSLCRTTDFPVRRSAVRRTSQSVAPPYDGLPSPSPLRTTDFPVRRSFQVPRLKPGATCFRRSAARTIRKRHSALAYRLEPPRRTRKSVAVAVLPSPLGWSRQTAGPLALRRGNKVAWRSRDPARWAGLGKRPGLWP